MKLCKTTSVFYYFLAFLYAVAAGGAILGWILSGAASVMFGDLGMVLISAVIIAALVLIFGFIFIYVHGALLLRAPRREDTLIYALYEAAGICFAVLHLCAGMVLNAVGIMNVWLSIVYYGVMLTIPLLGAGAMKQKRQEGVASGKTTEEQTKKKTVQSAPEREKNNRRNRRCAMEFMYWQESTRERCLPWIRKKKWCLEPDRIFAILCSTIQGSAADTARSSIVRRIMYIMSLITLPTELF